tara:strand:+ start:1624 stop:2382 length:759 start_codon:yes stop_codon:yes gene_type:complete
MSKILVIGDSCSDIFIYGNIERICPEAPVPVFNPTHKTKNGGMAKNVVKNLEALGCEVDLITNPNDIKKIRYVDNRSNQLVLRVDEHDYCKRVTTKALMDVDTEPMWGPEKYDAVIISDYCKGFLDIQDIEFICDNYINVFIDTKKQLGDWVVKADFIKINEFEHKKNFEILPNYPSLEDKLIVTRGKEGCQYMDKTYSVPEVPVKDVSGAGDTFLAGLVVEYCKTKDIVKSIKFAQECTTSVVQKHGVATI